MRTDITKSVVVPLDGSPIALKALNYLLLVFGTQHNLVVNLFHVVPGGPPILVEESKKDPNMARQVRELESRNKQIAAKALTAGKKALLDKGVKEENVNIVEFKNEWGSPVTSAAGPRKKVWMPLSSAPTDEVEWRLSSWGRQHARLWSSALSVRYG